MGYHAPRAEDVYRYVFRLDSSRADLCDGFSWSILFVNDNSPFCREFLARYGAEMCYRTADRIRFVFFSGLSTEETHGFVERANGRAGFLESIIHAAMRWSPPRNKFDWERNEWEMFRPEAFRPLDSPKKVQHQLSMECEIHSAMPGSQEALRLAQRLGIGRFVPCFLLFSDIGSPHVYLYPVARQSPDDVFRQLRGWIDSFYELNRTVLARWATLEESIKKLASDLRVSVNKVETWKRSRENEWNGLRKITQHLRQLERSEPSSVLLKGISDDWSLPWEVRDQVRVCLDQLVSIERQQQRVLETTNWLFRVRNLPDPARVFEELAGFRNRSNLAPVVASHLETTIALFKPTLRPESPESELARWWRSEYGRPPSRNRYDRYRHSWSEYSKRKYGPDAVGNVATILREEFAVISQTIMSQVITTPAESATQAVVDRIAVHIGVALNDPAWVDCVANYRESLLLYFSNLKSHAPNWLIDLGGIASPPISWGDCIPPVPTDQKTKSLKNRLDQLPRLAELVARVRNDWDACTLEREAEQERLQAQSLAELAQEIDAWLSSTSFLNADGQSLWLALIDGFKIARRSQEKQVFDSARSTGQAPYPGGVYSQNEVSRLLQLLDEYNDAIRSLMFPFAMDRKVLRVALDMPLPAATGVRPDNSVPVPLRVKEELREAAAAVERSQRGWESIRETSAALGPAGEFVHALREVVSSNRLSELFPSFSPADVIEANSALADHVAFVSTLDEMTVQELIALERKVCSRSYVNEPPASATKHELYDSILSAIGLRRDGGEQGGSKETQKTLQEKIRKGTFDVFLAHNSQDKAEVLRLGEELRHQGIYPWIDVEQIPPGRWFQDVIQSAVRTVQTAVIVIGKSGIGRWQMVELRAFVSRCIEQRIPLIPVLLPGTSAVPDDLAFLRELNYVRFSGHVGEKDPLASLVWGITGKKP